eukprot:COSAG01_NODE_8262_length_2852_cov_2.304395_1_plen_297_part_00
MAEAARGDQPVSGAGDQAAAAAAAQEAPVLRFDDRAVQEALPALTAAIGSFGQTSGSSDERSQLGAAHSSSGMAAAELAPEEQQEPKPAGLEYLSASARPLQHGQTPFADDEGVVGGHVQPPPPRLGGGGGGSGRLLAGFESPSSDGEEAGARGLGFLAAAAAQPLQQHSRQYHGSAAAASAVLATQEAASSRNSNSNAVTRQQQPRSPRSPLSSSHEAMPVVHNPRGVLARARSPDRSRHHLPPSSPSSPRSVPGPTSSAPLPPTLLDRLQDSIRTDSGSSSGTTSVRVKQPGAS